jgi:dolichol-phosphate mannosyltransferase
VPVNFLGFTKDGEAMTRKRAAGRAASDQGSSVHFDTVVVPGVTPAPTVFIGPTELTPDLTVIIPTRNEAGNVEPLLERIGPVISNLSAEVIFVDDSTDDTPDVVLGARSGFSHAIRLIHREPEQRVGGLGGAVLEGMREAHGHWLIVMDGDLQHPPELFPKLFQKALDERLDLVLASRYCDGGKSESFSVTRSILSRGSTYAAKALFPKRLHHVDDPMTGFFLVRRSALNLDILHPNGFKILLEIVTRTPNLRVGSVPFEFGERHAGESKASLREGMRFLSLLLSLRLGSAVTRFGQFGLVGISGLLVNTVMMAFFTEALGIHYMASLVLATQGSTLWNFWWSEKWVFGKSTGAPGQLGRATTFLVMNNAALLIRGPMVFYMTSLFGINYLVSNVLSMAVLLVLRFALADSLIWRVGSAPAYGTEPPHPAVAKE